ncbi:hypothetical protein BT63DRAFT_435332 [Microthyrium microscopicum]|uniref:Uncharacterized protein n=1 Tax=Microthyrium microscopicum TaxID=703497 RepID=A0A6A6UPH3_9PEZI|nr:hypothetical protein BT63DRAFT_435332 [Microthyrium microscopicum]
MHFPTLAILTTTLLTPLISASCFTSSQPWTDGLFRPNALNYAAEACTVTLGDRTYDQEEELGWCVNVNGNLRYNYNIKRVSGGQGYMSNAGCQDWLALEVTGCQNGGQSQHGDWIVTSDPNEGQF